MRLPVLPLVSLVLATATPALAASGGAALTLAHTGYLLNASDAPLTSTGQAMTFRIFDQAGTGLGTAQWEGTCAVDVLSGYYAVTLGSTACPGTDLLDTADVPANASRWLEIEVGSTTLTPRTALGAAPVAAWARQSLDADALITQLKAAGTVNATTNPVDWSQLKNVPAGFADGTDANTTYSATAGGGLALVGTTFGIAAAGVTNAMLEGPVVTGVTAGSGVTVTNPTGAGAATVGLNLASTNTWTGAQTFSGGLSGALTGAASANVLKAGDTMTGTLNLAANGLAVGTDQLVVYGGNGGSVGIGTTSPNAALQVASGQIVGKTGSTSTSIIDFATGNLQFTTNSCGAFVLWNVKDGATYTFGVKGATSATCTFTAFSNAGATALTMHAPPDNGPTTANKHTIYTFLVLGSDVYASWVTGL